MTLTPLAEYDVSIGQMLDLPPQASDVTPPADFLTSGTPGHNPTSVVLLWAKIKLQPKPLGRLIAAIYKPPPILLAVEAASHQGGLFQIIPANSADGFLLGPLPNKNDAIATITGFRPDPSAYATLMPIALAIMARPDISSEWYYESNVHISLYRMVLRTPAD